MSLFPKCSFKVLLPDGVVMPGTRVEGILEVEAPEPIPRAKHIELRFRSLAWAGYGSGRNRSVDRRGMFYAPLQLPVPDPMPAGTQRIPFAFDVPAWLPPGFRGDDCAIEHFIEVRVDVDWAIDPTVKLVPIVAVPAREGTRTPLTLRSPPGFHESIVLEVTLPSSVITTGEPLVGQVALRSGHEARFDAVELAFVSSQHIAMGRGDRRRGRFEAVRIPADALRGGEAVRFSLPRPMLPTFRSSFIDYDVFLNVSVDIPWATDPSFDLTLDVLQDGSVVHGVAGESVVGGERLRQLAAAMAQSTGLREGRAPVLAFGAVGPVTLKIVDAPREGQLGIDVDFTFPDVELGIAFHTLGLLEGFRASPLLPVSLANRYSLRCEAERGRPAAPDDALSAFVTTLLGDLGTSDDVRFSDHHLGAHLLIPNDEGPRMVEIARAAYAKAEAISRAIAALPFPAPLASARPAWSATAAEQNAVLVPTGPSLHGLTFRSRVVGGEERVFLATIRTVWKKEGPFTQVDIDLRGAPLPKATWPELEADSPSERLRAVRSEFPSGHVLSEGSRATLERPGAVPDPRALLSAVETFFSWVIEARGERRADSPYR